MSSLSVLFAATAFAATGPAATPSQPSSGAAELKFASENQMLAGIAYGIDAIDAQPRFFDQRVATNVIAGQRTIQYSCPNTPQTDGASQLTYTFEAGHRYELVCQEGHAALIRESDEC